jgi:hypothetical protein
MTERPPAGQGLRQGDQTHTASTEASEAPLLLLTIDLGEDPPIYWLNHQLEAILDIWDFVADTAPYLTPRSGTNADRIVISRIVRRDIDLVVRRTSLASPWESLITAAAGHAAWVGYAAAAVYGLERLLKMVMDWQNHRQSLEERQRARPSKEMLEEFLRSVGADGSANLESASRAVEQLDPVLDVQITSPDPTSGESS